MKPIMKLVLLFATLALVAAACGDDDAPAPTPAPVTDAPAPAATDAPAPAATDAPAPVATDAPAPADDGPIVIGAAIDFTDVMAVFDTPAIAAARSELTRSTLPAGSSGGSSSFE